jgi:hypothetical protein
MQNLDASTIENLKKLWSDPQITILSVKNNTLGGGATSSDATTQS